MAISTTVAGDVHRRSDRGAGKWGVAVLRGRTNVVDKGGSSGQEGEGRGRVVGVRPMVVWLLSTASTSAG
eukprot:scaffold23562_cov114-Amphora_coffeaeformis.AAC.1